MFDREFFKGKKILVTGHTGFKGTWMCGLLVELGAEVTGYALKPPTDPSLFEICQMAGQIKSIEGDVRDLQHLRQVFETVQPEIVIHMAAQPLVRESYQNPVYTYDVNVMGTVNVMECVRLSTSVKSFLNVTTDKVYLNREREEGYREEEELYGFDPYSNSKSCSELVTGSYKNSFFGDSEVAISTARAGNVIGGGDFATDRIIPDCIRAAQRKQNVFVRNPHSVRPYQHVLEPVAAYLMIVQKQYEDKKFAGSYNVGPDERDCITTERMVTLFCEKWNAATEDDIRWETGENIGPHEANYLKLDCTKLKETFGWRPVWDASVAMDKIVEWTVCYQNGGDMVACMKKQMNEFLNNFS